MGAESEPGTGSGIKNAIVFLTVHQKYYGVKLLYQRADSAYGITDSIWCAGYALDFVPSRQAGFHQ